MDRSAGAGYGSSIVIGKDKRPLIVSWSSGVDLHVLHCGNRKCTAGNSDTTLGQTDGAPSLALGKDGLPLISYSFVGLTVLHCGNPACTAGNNATGVKGTSLRALGSTAIAIGKDGLPLISYSDVGLTVLHCGNRTCSAGNRRYTVDPRGRGSSPSLTIGGDRLPLVSYADWRHRNLKVLHCGNTLCRPHR